MIVLDYVISSFFCDHKRVCWPYANKKNFLFRKYICKQNKRISNALGSIGRLFQKFLVEQELSQLALADHHFVQSWDLSGKIALTMVLFFQEITSQVVDKLQK